MAACVEGFCLVALCVVLKFRVLSGERVLGEVNEDFDFDGLPGVLHEFKVDIPGGKEDCFFQRAVQGAKFYVSFEVLRGGDRNVDTVLRNSQWHTVNAHYWKSSGMFDFEVPITDTYALCFDNTHSRFQGKLVYLYIVVFVMSDWTAYGHEMQEVIGLTQNFSQSLQNVDSSVQEMLKINQQGRFNVVKDWYLINSNNVYVQNWSLTQCVITVTASIVQVYFVRRLFRTTNVTPTSKPRA